MKNASNTFAIMSRMREGQENGENVTVKVTIPQSYYASV